MTLPVTFTLTSQSTQAAAPFVIGQAFKKGDVPAGSSVAVTGATAQVTPKNTWPDGSLKFAIIAGTAALTANVPATVTLSVGSASSGTALTTASFPAGLTASIDAGAFGSASWAGTDWNSPFEWTAGQTALVSGHRMSSWLYRKQIGSDAHLVAWLEVRLFAGGEVEILPWVENGYLKVAGPTSKSATYSFAMGSSAIASSTRFSAAIDITPHARTVLISGGILSHWLGTDPAVIPKHDGAYLQSTRMVPKYRANLATDYAYLGFLPTTWSPLQIQTMSDPNTMNSGGYDHHIGLLPLWDVAYLTCQDSRAYFGVIRNAYSSGRYGMHFRDEATNRPLRYSQHPFIAANSGDSNGLYEFSGQSATGDVVPAATGTVSPRWANSHHPSCGFMAYLITGRWYFMEESQFAATAQYLAVSAGSGGADHRGGAWGILQSSIIQVRGAAWGLRTLAQTVAITPDDDTALRAEFINSFAHNVTWYHGRYIAQANNPQGFVASVDLDIAGKSITRCWMQDFFTSAIGYAKDLDLAIGSTEATKLTQFFAHIAKTIVERLGGTGLTEYPYRDAAIYDIAVAPVDNPDWFTGTGPWYANWGQVYEASMSVPNPGVAGDLRNGNFPDTSSYWGNLQPAIAYAVTHGVAGAQAAYERMTGASNWSTLVADANTRVGGPIWMVEPFGQTSAPNAAISKTYSIGSGQTLYAGRQRPVTPPPEGSPLWLTTANPSVYQAVEIPNTAPLLLGKETGFSSGGSAGNWMDFWCGLAIDTRTSTVYSFSNGGHGDYWGNEINAFGLAQNAPAWAQLLATSSPAVVNPVDANSGAPYYPDGRPVSVHSYYQQQFIEARNRAARFPTGATAKIGHPNVACASYNILTNTCDAEGTYLPNIPQTLYAEFGPVCKVSDLRTGAEAGSEDVYLFNKNQAVYKWAQSTNTMSTVSLPDNYPPGAMNDYVYWASAYDPVRNRILLLNQIAFTFDISTRVFSVCTPTGAAAAAVMGGGRGLVYEPVLDKFIAKNDSENFYLIDPVTFAVTQMSVTGNTGMAGTTNGIFNRFLYVPALSGVVYFPRYTSNAWFLRTH